MNGNKEDSQVTNQICLLEKTIEETRELTEKLKGRLTSVLKPLVASTITEQLTPELVPLAGSLRELQTKLHYCNENLGAIITVCEL